jgi:hypothetical protein
MVKKKGDNPLAGLTRFNVDPMPVPEANKILGMQHRAAAREHDEWVTGYRTELAETEAKKKKPKYTKEQIMEGATDGGNEILSPSWNARADYLEKGMVTPFQWATHAVDRKGPLDFKGEPVQPGGRSDDYYSYGIDVGYEAPTLSAEPFGVPKSGKEITEWVGNDVRYRGFGAIRNSGRDLDPETIRGMYETSKTDMGSESGSKKSYSTAIPHVSQEQMAKEALAYIKTVSPDDTKGIAETEATLSRIQNQKTSNSGKSKDSDTKSKEATQKYYEEFWEKQKTEDPEAYAAHQKSLGKTGKVEEPALPQASEKPVAKKKKNEPEYIPSKSEKDFAAGRMPGITGTAEEAEAALARSRKASTAKVTGKAKEKLQGEIASHPDFRGTKQLSDEEVAANESGGSIRASESVAATAKTPKGKGKGKKKEATPTAGSPEVVEAEMASGTSAKRDAEFAEKDTRTGMDTEVSTTRGGGGKQYPYDRLAAESGTARRSETVPEYMARIQNVPPTQVVNDDSAIAGKGSTVPPSAPRSDSSGNTVDVSRFAGQPKKKDSFRDKYPDLAAIDDSMTPIEKMTMQADMDAADADTSSTSTPSSMPAPTGTGVASPTPTWGAPTGTGVASPTASPTVSPTATPASPTATPPVGSGGPRSAPPATPRVKGPGLGSRIGGFFGGHGGRGGGRAPSTSGGTSTPSTSSANTTNINYGAPTFGDQTNLGRNDFGGGSGGSGGSGSINMSANSNQANQVQGQNVRIGGSYGGTVGGPVVASTSGRATSNNPRATVLSTGGPASQTQGHPRAQNAQRGGRATSNNQTPTAPKTKNPRQQKP